MKSDLGFPLIRKSFLAWNLEDFWNKLPWFTASVNQDKYSDYGSLEDWIVWLDWFHDFVICVSWIASFLSILSFTFEHLWEKQNNGLMKVKFWKKMEDESFINYRFSFSPVIIKWLKSGSILHLEKFWAEKVSSPRLVDNVSCESEMTQKWENRRWYEKRWLKTRRSHTEEKESFTFCHFLIIAHHKLSMRKEYLLIISSICLFQTPKVPEDKGLYWCNRWFGSSNTWQVTGQKSLTFSESHKKGKTFDDEESHSPQLILTLSPSFFFRLSLLSSSYVLARCLRDQLRIVIGYNDLSNLTKVKQKRLSEKTNRLKLDPGVDEEKSKGSIIGLKGIFLIHINSENRFSSLSFLHFVSNLLTLVSVSE